MTAFAPSSGHTGQSPNGGEASGDVLIMNPLGPHPLTPPWTNRRGLGFSKQNTITINIQS